MQAGGEWDVNLPRFERGFLLGGCMPENEVFRAEFRAIREDITEIRGAFTKVAEALERLARLEERDKSSSTALERAFKQLNDMDRRLHELEKNEPMQTLASGWVVNVVWAAAGMAAMFMAKKLGVM